MKRYRYPAVAASEITPKHVFENRRRFLRQSATLGAALSFAPGMLLSERAGAWQQTFADKVKQSVSEKISLTGSPLLR
ncbi:twin-arginine translocation signal domain-containing protein [Halomonas sp. TBZ9]|uniref:Twin-arginine translocation signal domain-containing protein n=1 Tax=Vreelandella azerica TaxID=2732867 RepID=A0A7Y3TYG5_9GAMM|nr:twin-arginine translocation signal domain-containing protein [Halomonas azerica]NOG32080.1 twin-arginine translocation signal domain-containing protein [Halomonas azerica]